MALFFLAKEDGHRLASDEPTARNALELLVYHGLLRFTGATEEHWEFTHALTHQFSRTTGARELLSVLGVWGIAYFNHAVASVRQTDNFALLGAALNHAVTLLRADHDATELRALQSHLLYDGFEQIDALGRLDFARTAIEAVYDWVQRVLALRPDDTALQRELSMSSLRLGDIEVTAGQLEAAHFAYTQGLTIAAQLATQDPHKAQWQHDLSVNHDRVGDVLVAQGHLPEALTAYTASRTIRAQLATQDSHNAQWQRDLAVSHDRVGDVLVAQGHLPEALTAYTASRTIRAQLAIQDPHNAQWQHDLAVSDYKLGKVFVRQHKPTEALPYFELARTISARLVAQDPSNAIWRNDLTEVEQQISELKTKRSFWRRLFG